MIKQSLAAVSRELSAVSSQKMRLHELLELGEYDLPTFHTRMAVVQGKLSALNQTRADLQRQLETHAKTDACRPADPVATLLTAYAHADAAVRNALLKSLVETVWYTKEKKSKPRDFSLTIELKSF